MRQIFLIIFLSLSLITGYIIFSQNRGYDVKISIKSPNSSAIKTDLEIARNVKDKLTQIEQIKNIVIFSYPDYCNVYLEFHLFKNKNLLLSKIQNALSNYNYNIDFDYKKPYNYFLIVKSDNHKKLKELSDCALSELLNLNITKEITVLGERKNSVYIEFSSDILMEYDLSVEDVIQSVTSQNVKQKDISKINDKYYQITTNSFVKSVDDVENMTLYFKNNSFSYKLKDIFKIEEKEYEPLNCYINYDDKKAQILALKKRSFYPNFIFEIKLRNLINNLNKNFQNNFILQNPKKLSKTVVYLDEQSSILKTKEVYIELFKELKEKNAIDNLFFIGINLPKLKPSMDFFEFEKNKLIILNNNKKLTQKIVKSLGYRTCNGHIKEYFDDNLNNLYLKIEKTDKAASNLKKTLQINYTFDDYSLNDYFSDKKEILNYLYSRNGGLLISNFYEKHTETPIFLKDKEDDIYIYSKKFKNLINISSFIKPEVQKGFDCIVRKNKYYYTQTYN